VVKYRDRLVGFAGAATAAADGLAGAAS
jgi:hypothetical protein